MTCSQVLADIAANKTQRMMVSMLFRIGGHAAMDSLAHLVELQLAHVTFDYSRQSYVAFLDERQSIDMMPIVEAAA
jgi:hypothetical protein